MSKWIDRLLPIDVGRSPDELRRARLIIIFALALALSLLPNLIIVYVEHVWSVLALLLVTVTFFLTTPVVFRLTRSLPFAGNWLLLGMSTIHAAGVFYTGGYYSPGIAWWGTVAIASVMLLGNRTGLVWMGFFMLTGFTILVLGKLGVPVHDDVVPSKRSEAMFWSIATSLVAYYFLARIYEDLKQRMLTEIANSKLAVERAHASARAVLNNVSQGLVIAERDGQMSEEVSQALIDWFGAPPRQGTVFEYLAQVDARFASWLKLGWDQTFADLLPLEVALDQLPSRIEYQQRQFSVTYRPITKDQTLMQVLLVITDITHQIATERAEEQQREMLSALQRMLADRRIFVEFLEETRRLLQSLAHGDGDSVVERRNLHTLKGNAGLFGLTSIARQCHELESRVLEENRRLNAGERAELQAQWQAIDLRLRPLLGETEGQTQISVHEYEDALRAIAKHEPYAALASRLRVWAHEPTQKRLSLFADQAHALAKRLDKGELSVRIEDTGLRLPRDGLSPFWSTFVHVIRNAVDHGLESPDERRAAGKSEGGLITLSTTLEKSVVAVRVADDGRGIDWNRISEMARAKGLPAETRRDLEEALFSEGTSTKQAATETSGRGVGLGAVRAAVTELGGSIRIQTELGRGTEFTFLFPILELRPSHFPGAELH
jgi:two-component system chemotaxis sensor kinase CheA